MIVDRRDSLGALRALAMQQRDQVRAAQDLGYVSLARIYFQRWIAVLREIRDLEAQS